MTDSTIITTAGRPDSLSEARAKAAVRALGYPSVPRSKRSVRRLMEEYDADVLVAGKERYELYRAGSAEPLFFHPDTSVFRLKRLLNGKNDPLIEAALLKEGDSFLDGTLGLATDAIVASFAAGPSGRIVGVEADPDVAFITQNGLRQFDTPFPELRQAMGRIRVIQGDSADYFASLGDGAFDVVFLDPMFSRPVGESISFAPLRNAGTAGGLTARWVAEAVRVASRRVVLKAHFSDPSFEQFGFTRIVRPNTKFHFGFIQK